MLQRKQQSAASAKNFYGTVRVISQSDRTVFKKAPHVHTQKSNAEPLEYTTQRNTISNERCDKNTTTDVEKKNSFCTTTLDISEEDCSSSDRRDTTPPAALPHDDTESQVRAKRILFIKQTLTSNPRNRVVFFDHKMACFRVLHGNGELKTYKGVNNHMKKLFTMLRFDSLAISYYKQSMDAKKNSKKTNTKMTEDEINKEKSIERTAKERMAFEDTVFENTANKDIGKKRGIRVHKDIQIYVEGGNKWAPEYVPHPWSRKIIAILTINKIVPLISEFTVWDPLIEVATNVDLICMDRFGNIVAVELKTGTKKKGEFTGEDARKYKDLYPVNPHSKENLLWKIPVERALLQALISDIILQKYYDIKCYSFVIHVNDGVCRIHKLHDAYYKLEVRNAIYSTRIPVKKVKKSTQTKR